MKNFQPITTFDPVPVLNEIMRQPELWKADTYLRDYPQGPFGDTETIFVRFPPASVTELERGQRDQHECVWMDGSIHLPSVRPLIFALMSRVQGERLGRVMINKLRPGGRVYPHADTPAHAQYWDRYHLVIKSGPGCNFRCGDETIYMPPCTVWWFQNQHEHEVVNNSADDRIHMIVDIRTSRVEATGVLPTKPAETGAFTFSAPAEEEPSEGLSLVAGMVIAEALSSPATDAPAPDFSGGGGDFSGAGASGSFDP